MKYFLRFLFFFSMVGYACAQSNNTPQQAGTWKLMVVELVMYPGSSVQYKETLLATFDFQSQCEAARKGVDTRYNSSTKCVQQKKSKVNV
jgi:hypothetical protein